MTLYLMCFALFLTGLYGVLTKRDMIKIILSTAIIGYSVNLFLILFAYRKEAIFPILSETVRPAAMVDPLPQALVLTSIVIELGSTALLVALAIRLVEKYKTFDIQKIRRLFG